MSLAWRVNGSVTVVAALKPGDGAIAGENMPTGPRARHGKETSGKALSKRVRETDILLQAWHEIRRNGETSRSPKTRQATKDFGADLPRQIRHIQERLRRPPYKFTPQIGATPRKEKGEGKRPLVIAPIEDRIVQRAILDVLQTSNRLTKIQAVLSTPTSIGGIPGRGVGDAIKLIEDAHKAGNANFVAGSDISGFFTKIDQSAVVNFVNDQIDDKEFVELLRQALKVELANASEMDPDDLRLFPTDDKGVAQGCPLSALAGNIVLHGFDQMLNGRGIRCIRYIDDFIILGRRKVAVEKAFERAGEYLKKLDMSVYFPHNRPDKAFFGPFSEGFEFLGYRLVSGIYPPAKKSKKRIIEKIKVELNEGFRHILRALNGNNAGGKPLQCYAQTLVAVDSLVRAWSGSYSASRCLKTAGEIDDEINGLISDFIAFYRAKVSGRLVTERRRALGIHVVVDDIRRRLESDTAREEIASVIAWAERMGYADVPAIAALRHKPTRATVLAAIRWADSEDFRDIASDLRERSLKL
jgi:RNA-directed DNA polymerase